MSKRAKKNKFISPNIVLRLSTHSMSEMKLSILQLTVTKSGKIEHLAQNRK